MFVNWFIWAALFYWAGTEPGHQLLLHTEWAESASGSPHPPVIMEPAVLPQHIWKAG